MNRWRLVLAALLAAAIGLTVAVVVRGAGDAGDVPEGGSSFGAVPAPRPHPGTTLLDALAGVLADTGPATRRRTPARKAAGSRRTTPAAALPAAIPDATARLFLVGFGGTTAQPPLLRSLALHDWAGYVLERDNGVSARQVAELVGTLRGAARQAHGREPLVAAVTPGGFNAVPGVGPPAEITARSDHQARDQAAAAAQTLRSLGISMVLGPSADLAIAGGPWAARGFSDDPATAATRTAAAVTGWKSGGIAPVVGHYPGEGGASADPSVQQATVGTGLQELANHDVLAFAEVLGDTPAVQLSAATYVAFDGVTPATLLPDAISLLRHQGFRGVVVSGDLAAASLATGQPVSEMAIEALKAGCDLLWIPGDAADQDAAWRAVVRAVRSGEVPRTRVAAALRRVAALRQAYGVR